MALAERRVLRLQMAGAIGWKEGGTSSAWVLGWGSWGCMTSGVAPEVTAGVGGGPSGEQGWQGLVLEAGVGGRHGKQAGRRAGGAWRGPSSQFLEVLEEEHPSD